MPLDTAQATANLRSLTATFDLSVSSASPYYNNICTVRNSSRREEDYGFLGNMPGVREWLGDRVFHQLRSGRYLLENKEWESSLAIERSDIEDDRLGMYDMAMAEMGNEAAHHPDELLSQVIIDGESEECFDGQNFFDTDHAWGDSGTQSNDLTSNAADPNDVTESEFRDAYHAARLAMLTYKRDNGKPWVRPTIGNRIAFTLLVPPSLEEVATKAVEKTLVNSGETNIVLTRPTIVPFTHLTDQTKFYLLRTDTPLRPFVFQNRRDIQRSMKGMNDREFKDVRFMTDARYACGYLAWWNAVLTTFV